jgi:FKBP-type peptidyl-prolyl cis-trans isomerase
MAKGAKMEIRHMLMAGVVLLGSAVAQQPPAKSSTPAAKTSAAQLPEAPAAKAQTPSAFATQKEKDSYAIGMNVGTGLRKQDIDIDPNVFLQGLKDSFSGGKTLLTEEEYRATLEQLQKTVLAKREEKIKALSEANKKEGEAFLAENKTKAGVVALASGLQYKILQQGTGPKPTAADTVVCNYKGTFINGTEFDSSAKHGGQPATFIVGRVIPGWTEALQLMPTGSKWQLFIPGDLAYGERGAGNDIGPNSTLIFEVELVSIQAKPALATPAPSPAPK